MRIPEMKFNRLSVFELAQLLDTAGTIYHQQDISHTQFQELKERFQHFGIEGLKDLQTVPKNHLRKTSTPIVELILKLSLEHPGWGCVRLAQKLENLGYELSSPTIQKILIKNGMGNKNERLVILEEEVIYQNYQLSKEQLGLLEKANPCFRERFSESTRPGESLSQVTVLIGNMKGIGKIYLQSVVDTYNSFAFGFLHDRKVPDYAVAILHNEVIPFYKNKNLPIKKIITSNSREFCGTEKHHYELYLLLNEIEHQKTRLHDSRINGFVERFIRIAQAEFFAKILPTKFYDNLEDLQNDFEQWLSFYNNERIHSGYRNMGKTPFEILNQYLES